MNFLKTTTIICFILCSVNIFAQDALDAIAQETCDCLEGKDLSNMSQEDSSVEVGMCMMSSLSTRQDKITELGIDITDQSSMEKFGEKIGMKMAVKCPKVLMGMGMMRSETTTTTTTKTMTSTSEKAQVMTGKVKAIEGDEFSVVVIEDETGRSQKFLWLRYFAGSEKLMENPKSVIGKSVKVKFSNIEVYSPKAKEYFNRKELKGIEF